MTTLSPRAETAGTTDFMISGSCELPLSPAAQLLAQLLDSMVVLPEEWDELSGKVRENILSYDRTADLLPRLVECHLLTPYQAFAIGKGRMSDLIVGHYRLLEQIGRGGMGVVYRAEHVHLRRTVALKLMASGFEDNPRLLNRFFLEARAVARLKHPHLVSCLDAGRHEPSGGGQPARSYYVMELISGSDLSALVTAEGALPIRKAAGVFRQVADALAEAHRHQLIHRDIKPSNIFVTTEGEGKLLDFGLALHPHRQMTDPGTLLGTVGYMAPEQAINPSTVDPRADLFSLGASLFLAVTGREPFPDTGAAISDLTRRMAAPPPRVRGVRPELPVELDELIARLLDPVPERRLPSAASVAAALTPFQRWRTTPTVMAVAEQATRPRVLVVDDEQKMRRMIKEVLTEEYEYVEAGSAEEALAKMDGCRFDLLVVDLNLPVLDGATLIQRVRLTEPSNGPMVMLISGKAPAEALGGLLLAGADDFIQKPFSPAEFRGRVRGLLARRRLAVAAPAPPAPGQAVRITDTLRMAPSELTRPPLPDSGLIDFDYMTRGSERNSGCQCGSNAAQSLAVTVSRLLEAGGVVSRGHSRRLTLYLRAMAPACPSAGEYRRLHDPAYLDLLAAVLPMHDLGHLLLPPDLMQKSGRLTADERMVMQTHTTAGSEVLMDVAKASAGNLQQLSVAAEVVRSHHERWDGQGYPDMLRETEIPLTARLTALVSVYDALRSRRPYRPSISHSPAVRLMLEGVAGQFDPVLLAAFAETASQFDQLFQQHSR